MNWSIWTTRKDFIFKEGLKYLEKVDLIVICTNNGGSYLCVIARAGEFHFWICLKELLDLMDKVKSHCFPLQSYSS